MKLVEAINELACAVRELKTECGWSRSLGALATKDDLKEMERNIMSAISDYAAKQTAFNDRSDKAIADISDDIKGLNDLIAKLQNSPGSVTPEDQALLDSLTTRGQSIADKLDALDALTPPVPPPAA